MKRIPLILFSAIMLIAVQMPAIAIDRAARAAEPIIDFGRSFVDRAIRAIMSIGDVSRMRWRDLDERLNSPAGEPYDDPHVVRFEAGQPRIGAMRAI